MTDSVQVAGGEPLSSDTTAQRGFISNDLTGVCFRNEPSPRKQWLYNSGAMAFRSDNYKIHLSTKDRSSNPDTRRREPMAQHDPPQLFDLSKDVSEEDDLSGEHPEILARLLKEMAAFRGE